MKLLLQWLYPGLNIKRWLLLFSLGLMVVAFGVALIMNYQVFGQVEEEILRLLYVFTGTYDYAFLATAGIGLIIAGIIVMHYALRKLVKRFFALVAPDEEEVSKQIASRIELSRGVRIVAIGGGHGLSTLLKGLKQKTSNISAIVTVADDGGSSGRLREEMDIIAPGDLRNCLVALADKDTALEQLFQYRFGGEGELSGHSLGNLFLAALIKDYPYFQFIENKYKSRSVGRLSEEETVMSFTEQVKNELARVPREDKESRTGELLALLRMSSSLITGGKGKRGLEFSTGNSAVARRVLVCLKKDFGLDLSAMVRQGRQLRKKNVYTLVVRPSEKGLQFLSDMDMDPLADIRDAERLVSKEAKRAYLAGAFLGGGTVSRPQGDYHLEMVTRSIRFAREIIKIMRGFGMNARMTERKNDYIVYVKDGDDVSSFLQISGASQSYMDFESVRVVKEMRNRVNRQVNCETANLQKSVNAAVRQTQHVQSLLQLKTLSQLSPAIREACEVRLKYPNASLSELAEICGITKSGLAHRYKKIADMVDVSHGKKKRRK